MYIASLQDTFLKLIKNKLFWIMIVALLARVPNLGESYWYDELLIIQLDDLSFKQMIEWETYHAVPHILYLTIMNLWAALFGANEIIGRIPSVICGLLSILITFYLAKRYVSQEGALFVSLWLALSPVHVWYSQEARNYSFYIFGVVTLIYLFEKLSDRVRVGGKSKKLLLAYSLCAVCLILIHIYGIFIVAAISFITLISLKNNSKYKKVFFINIFLFILFAYLLYGKREYINFHSYLRNFSLFEWWQLIFNWFFTGNSIWPIIPYHNSWREILSHPGLVLCQALFAVIFFKGLWRLSLKKIDRNLIIYISVAPICLYALSWFPQYFHNYYIERSLVPLLPLCFIVLAKGLEVQKSRLLGWGILLSVLIVIVNFTGYLNANFLFKDQWNVYKPNPDWKGLAQHFSDIDEKAMVYTTGNHDALKFYAKDTPVKVQDLEKISQIFDTTTMQFKKDLKNITGMQSIKHAYIVFNLYWVQRGDSEMLSKLNQHYQPVENDRFSNLKIYRYDIQMKSE